MTVDCASHASERIGQLRRLAVRRATNRILDGDRHTALALLLVAVERQALLSGLGKVTLPRP